MKTLLRLTIALAGIVGIHAPAQPAAPAPSRVRLVQALPSTVEKSPSIRFSGTIVDSADQVVDGVSVDVYKLSTAGSLRDGPLDRIATLTTTNGAFETRVPPATVLLVIRKPGFATTWQQWYNVTGETSERITIYNPADLAGVIVDDTGAPVSGARISVAIAVLELDRADGGRTFSYLPPGLARALFATSTGPDGRFRIRDFPTNASALLACTAPGRTLAATAQPLRLDSLPFRAGQADIRLELEPAGSIEGHVVLPVGESLPTAQLALRSENESVFASLPTPVIAESDGAFRFDDVLPGSYAIHVQFGTNSPPDWIAEPVPVSVTGSATNRDCKVLPSRGGILEIAMVGSSDNAPQSDVNITVAKQGYRDTTISRADGTAALRLPPGSYHISAFKTGSRAEESEAQVELDKTNRVQITIASPGRITGIVRLPDGQPAAGVELRMIGSFATGSGAAPTTDENGRFDLPFSTPEMFGSADFIPCLLARDAARNLAAAVDIDEESGPLDVRLAPGLTLACKADSDGKPITNATAALVFWSGRSGLHLTGVARTNETGRFEIPALPPGRRYGLYASAPGYGRKYVTLPEDMGETLRFEVEPIELLPANMRVAGVVIDAEEKPVPGANVNISGENQPHAVVRTDAKGQFAFNSVCEGDVQLYANGPNISGSLRVLAGDTNVTLRLGESTAQYEAATLRTLKGVVHDPDGKPIGGAEVAVFPSPSSRVTTAANGTFTLRWRLESWQLSNGGDPIAIVRHVQRGLAAAEPVPEDSTNAIIQLKPALSIKGHVESERNISLTNARIEVLAYACNTYSSLSDKPVATDGSGNFEIATLPGGVRFLVYASAKGHGRKQETIELDSEAVELEPIILKVADQVIAGQVLDENEKPLRGANVQLLGDDQPQESVTTDRNGQFRFTVCAGSVRLFANGSSGYANTSVEAGDTNVIIVLTRDAQVVAAPTRASLKGKPLPALAETGLHDVSGKPLLLCVVDTEQRPSRRAIQALSQQFQALRDKGVTVAAIQAASASPETFQAWTNSTTIPFPIGQITAPSKSVRWLTAVESMPWLILTKADGIVVDEGFDLDDLDSKLKQVVP